MFEMRFISRVSSNTVLLNMMKTFPADALNRSLSYKEAVKEVARMTIEGDVYRSKVPNMVRYLKRVGYKVADLSNLKILHVTGTKGKGSTCMFCESILRHHGYKTGVFSSPHLFKMTERFLLDGKPVTQDIFSNHFWNIYNKLLVTKEFEEDMPEPFCFFTVMAFDLFLDHRVDALLAEVGVGGEYDSTNVIDAPVVCGVTSVHLDHVSKLGNTLELIAWHKSGIFKPGVPALTIPQHAAVMSVLTSRAKERETTLTVVPPLNIFETGNKPIKLGIPGDIQKYNASLAVQMCRTWLDSQKGNRQMLPSDTFQPGTPSTYDPSNVSLNTPEKLSMMKHETKLTDEELQDKLSKTRILGRLQTVSRTGVTYFLDHGHTDLSIQVAADWFKHETSKERKNIKGRSARILLFYLSLERDINMALAILRNIPFDSAIFAPFSGENEDDIDNFYQQPTREEQLERAFESKKVWDNLNLGAGISHKKEAAPNSPLGGQEESASVRDDITGPSDNPATNSSKSGISECLSVCPSYVAPSVHQALKVASQGRDLSVRDVRDSVSLSGDEIIVPEMPESVRNADHIQILIVGGVKIVAHSLCYLQASD